MRRRKILCLVLILLLVLVGIGTILKVVQKSSGDAMQSALDFRAMLMEREKCTFDLSITVDQGDKVYSFSGQCQYLLGQSGQITLTEPESLTGIQATVTDGTTNVTFEDVQLELGEVAMGHVSPMALPLLLGNCWTEEYIVSSASDGEGKIQIVYSSGYEENQLMVYTWFEEESMQPVYYEVFYQGDRVLRGEISQFSV